MDAREQALARLSPQARALHAGNLAMWHQMQRNVALLAGGDGGEYAALLADARVPLRSVLTREGVLHSAYLMERLVVRYQRLLGRRLDALLLREEVRAAMRSPQAVAQARQLLGALRDVEDEEAMRAETTDELLTLVEERVTPALDAVLLAVRAQAARGWFRMRVSDPRTLVEKVAVLSDWYGAQGATEAEEVADILANLKAPQVAPTAVRLCDARESTQWVSERHGARSLFCSRACQAQVYEKK